MNIKHYFSFFGVSLLLSVASCTSEIEKPMPQPGPGEGENDDPNRREVLIDLKNNLQLKRAATTKAADEAPIATEDENYIHTLDVYVFGSKEEQGTYTFQELHYYRNDASEVTLNGVKSFSFNLAATPEGNTSALLKLNKGLFVKLYVVANRTELYQTDAGGAPKKYTDFLSLVQEGEIGKETHKVTPGKPALPDFQKFHTQLIDPLHITNPTADDILNAPLPMTGAYTTPLDLTDFGTSARTQISFKLSRMVARFDIVNDAAKSKFTIEKISMGKGRTGASFFPIKELTRATGNLVSYPERTLSAVTQQKEAPNANPALATTSVSKGAFYTWPSPTGDEAYLILKGQYAVNMSQVQQVSYKIPFQQVVNGVGSYVEVQYNHRYTIAITAADDYHLDFTINVENWDEKEPALDYEPDNDFDKGTKIVLDAAKSQGAYVLDNGNVELLPAPGSKFAFKMGSNTKLNEELDFKDGIAWFEKDDTRPAVTKATSMNSVYAYKIIDAALIDISKLQPATIRLTNPASGMRKEIKVVPTPGPVVTFAESAPKNFNVFDPATHTATIYNVDGQTIKLNVAATTRTTTPLTGSTVAVAVADGGNWLTPDAPSAATAEGEYKLTLVTAQTPLPATSPTVTFKATASDAKTVVTVKLKDPKMTALTKTDFTVGSTGNTIDETGSTVTLVGVKNGSFTATVTSPEGVTSAVTRGATWLAIDPVQSETKVDGVTKTTITGKITDATGMGTNPKADGVITITNVLGTQPQTINVHTSLPTSPTVSRQEVAGELSSYNAETKTATLYNGEGQGITFTTPKPVTVATTNAWLEVVKTTDTEHVIKVKAGYTTGEGTVTFTSVATGAVTTVKVASLKPAAITALKPTDLRLSTGTNVLVASTGVGVNAKVTMTGVTAASTFILTVVSPEGISKGAVSPSWLDVQVAAATGTSGSKSNIVTVKVIGTPTIITDGTIVLTNAIVGGGDMTIDVVSTVPTP